MILIERFCETLSMERRLDPFLANFVSTIWDIHMVASKLEFALLKTVVSPFYFGENHIFVPTFLGDSHFGS